MNQEICNKCGSVKELKPAGVSKSTGKKYSAFWGCDNKECWSKPKTTPNAQSTVKQQNIEEFNALEARVRLLEAEVFKKEVSSDNLPF